jgi:hypothetical protein
VTNGSGDRVAGDASNDLEIRLVEVAMFRRTVHRSPGATERRRPPWRLLVESAEPGVDIANFDAFRYASFEVTVCEGPASDARECPVVRGDSCPLMSEADVVLFDLDSDPARRSEVLAAMRATRPDLPIVVRSADPAAEAAAGSPTIRTTTSVNGQVSALHKAVLRWTRPRA